MKNKVMLLSAIVVSCHCQADTYDNNQTISNKWVSPANGSFNVGVNKSSNVTIGSKAIVSASKYFSVATCPLGNSSSCPEGLTASVNVDAGVVAATSTIVGDGAKGTLTLDNDSRLYTSQLWVSGNDNDKNATTDSSNGELKVNNSKIYVVTDMASSSEVPEVISGSGAWDKSVLTSGNHGIDDVSGGDLILGKTGNGIITLDKNSLLSVENDVIVSTGVTGAPNDKPSEIHISNGSNFNIGGDMRGGVSASGQLQLTMDKTSNMDVKGNVSVGIGNKSDVSVDMADRSIMHVGKNFDIATGSDSTAKLSVEYSGLFVDGTSNIGGGDASTTTASLTNQAVVVVGGDMDIAKGNNTHVDMTINDSSLTTGGALSVGSGDSSVVTMKGEKATLFSKGELTAAKGEGATAKLDYTNSKLTTGSAVIASGDNAAANVDLKNQSVFTSNGAMDIGQGTKTTTALTLSGKSQVNALGDMSVAKGNQTEANVIMSEGSGLSAGSLSVGEGVKSVVTLHGTDATLTTQKGFVAAKGEEATAKLDYTNSKLATGSAVIASGNNASAELKLEQSSFTSSGAMDIGQGTDTTTTLTLNNKSQINAQGAMSVAKGEGTKANVDMSGGSALSAGSLSIGEGKASESILHGTDATLTTQQGFVVAKGEEATAKLDYTNSKLATGSAVIASGNNASAELKLEQSSFTSSGDMIIGQGTGSSATMESNNTLISAQGSYVAAQGNNATASLKYNNTDITVGGAVLGAGEGAKATLDFNNSRLVSSGGVVIGDGQNAVAELSLSDGSVFKGERINIGNGTSSQNTITVTGGSVFDFGSSQNSAIGEGESSHSVVTVNNGYLYGDGSLTLAKGKNSSAELNLQDNAVSNANNISLATESGSRAIVNISNANSGQFNPVSMGAGDGYAEVNFDGVNGYTLSTNFLCMDSRTCTDTVMNIKRGTVSLSGTNDWKGQINVYDGTRLDARGNDAVDGMLNVSREARVDFNGYSQHMTGIDNKGVIYLSDGSASSDVYLDKDYVAHDGSGVQFGIFGQKEADVMHVNGDTSGRSGIVVATNSKNKIKKGGDILLVEVNGESSGSFYLNSLIKNGKEHKVTGDYIDVGAWEYALNKKKKNWYLSVDMRPEPGAFINNSRSMLDMFSLQRYDIPGQHRYPTLFENLYNNGMWIRYESTSGKNHEEYNNLKSDYNRDIMMLGADVYNWTDGYNFSQVGVMGGVGNAKNETTSTNSKKANGSVDGYTAGLYHIYQQNFSDGLNDSERQGLWTYSAIQYMDYDNSVDSSNKFNVKYKANAFRLTGEVGYLKNLLDVSYGAFYVEPKLYMSHTELSGGSVEGPQGEKISSPDSVTKIEPGVLFSYRKTRQSTSDNESFFKDYIKQSVVDAWVGGAYSVNTGNYSNTDFDSDTVRYKDDNDVLLKSGVEFEFIKDSRVLVSSTYKLNDDREFGFMLGGSYYF
ncbi:autotransporter outer membrane beta-barrel domain-containing protein [Escherichia coli]